MAQIMSAGLEATTNLFPIFFIEDSTWRSLWLVLASLAIIFGMSSASSTAPISTPRRQPNPRLAAARVRLAQAAADRRVEVRRTQTRDRWVTLAFPFRRLPAELQLAVLSHCSDSLPTYQSLSLVSRYMYFSTLRACLPHMPISLLTTKELGSFSLLVQKQFHHADQFYHVGSLIKYLWVTPLTEADYRLGHIVLKTCTNVQVLACDQYLLDLTIANASRHRHTSCRELTLLLSRPHWEVGLLTKPRGRDFLGQLTHLRVMGERTVPRSPGFWKLTHISYFDFPKSEECSEEDGAGTPWMLDDPQLTYPSLQHVVLTKRCGAASRPPEKLGKMLTLRHVLRDATELGMWRESVTGSSVWTAIAEAAKRPLKAHKDLKGKLMLKKATGPNTRSL